MLKWLRCLAEDLVEQYSLFSDLTLHTFFFRFEWSDGIVISAMRAGAPLLVDEISLAEDSVLERLNPLFEENR